MFIAIGVLFIVFEGTSALEGLYASRGATDLAFAAEWWVNGVAESFPLSLALAVGAVLLAGFVLYRRTRRGGKGPGKGPAGHEG
jgi:hypothetical protein